MESSDILIIGAGITGAITASLLRKTIPGARVVLWEKSRAVGGRMRRMASPTSDTCGADVGAQFITTSAEAVSRYRDIYSPLLRDKIIDDMTVGILRMKTFDEGVRHYVAPESMCSLVRYFLRDVPEEDIRLGTTAVAIEEDSGKFRVASEEGACSADVVVSTVPVPEFLQISGAVGNLAKKDEALRRVEYSSRFALILFYERDKLSHLKWACQFLNHSVFRFVSVDNVKRNRPDDPAAVVFHTSVGFGAENSGASPADLTDMLVESARDLFPELPPPRSSACHKWSCSQVTKPYSGTPGCLLLKDKPTLILGGDSFSQSNFDGCAFSACEIAKVLRRTYKIPT